MKNIEVGLVDQNFENTVSFCKCTALGIPNSNLHLKSVKPMIHEEPHKIETNVYEQEDEMKTTLVIINCIILAIGNMYDFWYLIFLKGKRLVYVLR